MNSSNIFAWCVQARLITFQMKKHPSSGLTSITFVTATRVILLVIQNECFPLTAQKLTHHPTKCRYCMHVRFPQSSSLYCWTLWEVRRLFHVVTEQHNRTTHIERKTAARYVIIFDRLIMIAKRISQNPKRPTHSTSLAGLVSRAKEKSERKIKTSNLLAGK